MKRLFTIHYIPPLPLLGATEARSADTRTWSRLWQGEAQTSADMLKYLEGATNCLRYSNSIWPDQRDAGSLFPSLSVKLFL